MNPCKFIPSRRPVTKLRKWLRKNKSSKRRRPPARPPAILAHLVCFASPDRTMCSTPQTSVINTQEESLCFPNAEAEQQKNQTQHCSCLGVTPDMPAYMPQQRTQTHKPRTHAHAQHGAGRGTQAARHAAAQTNTLKIQTTHIPNTPAP